MRVLVTGAAGLCGTHLIKELVEAEEVQKIFGVENFSRGYPCKEDYQVPVDWEGKFQIVNQDYQNLSVKELNNMELDVVVHLAAYNSAHESMETPEEYFANNDSGTLSLLQKLQHTKRRPFFVFASTVEVYGKPIREPVSEKAPSSCLNLFSATKMASEGYCSAFFHWYNYPLVILRFSNIYGENENTIGYSNFVCDFITKALMDEPIIIYGCGNQKRDFLYAKDAAKAISKAIERRKDIMGHVFNIANGRAISIEELATKITGRIGRNTGIIKLPVCKGDYPGFSVDISKAKGLLGWSPTVNLEQGLLKTIQWHKEVRNLDFR